MKHEYAIDYEFFHNLSIHNREVCKESDKLGCYHCLHMFKYKDITEWADPHNDTGDTAICPKCGIDAILASKQVEITFDLLDGMYKHWFVNSHKINNDW